MWILGPGLGRWAGVPVARGAGWQVVRCGCRRGVEYGGGGGQGDAVVFCCVVFLEFEAMYMF